jgi:hypothetical protein
MEKCRYSNLIDFQISIHSKRPQESHGSILPKKPLLIFPNFSNRLSGVYDGEDIVETLTFYPLDCVPDILTMFYHKLDKDLFDAINRQIEIFDPNDPYWSGDQEI